MATKQIITDLKVAELEKLQSTLGNNILIIKFGAADRIRTYYP